MKTTLYILFFILSFDSIAQDTLGKWSFGAVGGVERMGRRLSDAYNNQDAIDKWNSLEKNVWRMTGGLRLQRSLSSHLSIYSGLHYADRGYQIDSLSEAGINSLDFHFRYIEVPVGVVYSGLKFGKNALLAGAAVQLGVGMGNVVYYFKDGQTAQFDMKAVSDINPITLNVSTALGIRRAITNAAHLDVYLNGSQSMSPIASGSLERRFFSYGISVALTNTF